LSANVIKKTYDATTQYAHIPMSTLLTKHFKSPHPALNVPRRQELLTTDTIFSDTPAVDSDVIKAQFYIGTKSLVSNVYGIKTEKQFVNTLEDQIRRQDAPDKLIGDRAQVEISERVKGILRAYVIGDWQSEPHQQHQNPAERHYQTTKRMTDVVVMERTGSPAYTWLLAMTYVCFLLNHVAHVQLNWRTPRERLTGTTPDISPLLRFHWWEEVYYKIDDSDFPSDSREARGRIVGISEHVGHAMTYSILTDDTLTTIQRSNVRSASITDAPNMKADIFSGEAKEQLISSKISENGQGTEDNRLMVIQSEDLIGRTFLPHGTHR
jgi:hypothetical protein